MSCGEWGDKRATVRVGWVCRAVFSANSTIKLLLTEPRVSWQAFPPEESGRGSSEVLPHPGHEAFVVEARRAAEFGNQLREVLVRHHLITNTQLTSSAIGGLVEAKSRWGARAGGGGHDVEAVEDASQVVS